MPHYFWKNKYHDSRGYTLLFAVLTATLVLGVAVFILGVSKKQYALSVAARDSTFALYAADSGLECAIAASSGIASTTGGTIACNGFNASVPTFGGTQIDYPVPSALITEVTQSSTIIPFPDESCARIIFTMGKISSDLPVTVIDSRGYNYCRGDSPDASQPRIVERGLRYTQLGVWR